jgi:DNA polymerase
MYLVGDFETRSKAEITEVGLHNYAIHPSTRALMFGWRIVQDLNDKPPVEMWEPRLEPMSDELTTALYNSEIPIIAYNSAFERYIFQYVLGITIPAWRFQDPQPSARYLSLPKSLDDVGMILGLPMELRKDKRGVELMKIFSFPQTRKKKDGGGTYFIEPEDLPKEWEEYKDYCRQDCRAEQEVARREMLLGVFPLPDRERAIWLFDQKVNDRGVPTDKGFVEKALKIAERDKKDKLAEQNRKTGLANANSRDQLLPWVRERGYPLGNLRKQNVELVLKDPEVILTEECRDVLTARLEASSTSYKKLESILSNISPDGFLRNQFIFMGSSRCGRWSGNAVQLHNFARPDATFEDLDNVRKARNLIYEEDYDSLKTAFVDKDGKHYSPLMIVKNIIRTVFVAPPDKRFNVCDLNAIETRVGAWFAGCQPLLDVFEKHHDPYLDFATKMYGIPYEKLWADYKGKNGREAQIAAKRMRQVAKPGVLGAIYRMGGGRWGKDKNGDSYKTGLWGYSEGMGIDMSQEQAYEVVKIFRNAFPEICGNGYSGEMKGMWVQLEEAIADVLNGERTIRKIGPGGCVTIDKISIDGRDPMLRIQLPSGRYLHYLDAKMRQERMPWKRTNRETGKEEDAYRPAFTYYSQDQETHMWIKIVAHGGHTFENIVQGIARDVLADKLLEFEAIGLAVALHVHDEGACLAPDDYFAPGVLQMMAIMDRPVDWAPTLPLGSDGFEDAFYHKG